MKKHKQIDAQLWKEYRTLILRTTTTLTASSVFSDLRGRFWDEVVTNDVETVLTSSLMIYEET